MVTDPRQPDNPIVAVNSAFSRLTGYGAPELVGRNCRILAGEKTDPGAAKALQDAVHKGKSAFAELLNYRKDGTAFLNAVMIAPWYNDAGELEYFFGSQVNVSTDDTAIRRRKRAENAVSALTRRQSDVLLLMAEGLRNKEIAARLAISEKTVKMHRASMLKNLGAGTSADAVRMAVEAGL